MPSDNVPVSDNNVHLIIGGTGFIGRHVALQLARMGKQVVIASRLPPKFTFPPEVSDRIKWIMIDISNVNWDEILVDATSVHYYTWTTIPASANQDPEADLSNNVASVIRLLEALRRHNNPPRLIFTSSGGTVYGKLRKIPAHEDHALAPITAYGAGKAAAEFYIGYYRVIYGLDCRIIRLSNPYGAGQDFSRGQGAVTTFLHHAVAGKPITIWGDGEIVRDYIHISDAVNGIVSVSLSSPHLEYWTFNIASGHGVSINGILYELENQMNHKFTVFWELGRSFDVPISVLDVSRANVQLGWAPRIGFPEGIARTLQGLQSGFGFSTIDPHT